MSVQEIARLCAQQIHLGAASNGGEVDVVEVERWINGAIQRALDEAKASPVQHVFHPGLRGVDVKLTKSTMGVSVEIDVKRALEPGETYELAADRAADIVAYAYAQTLRAIEPLGLTPGKEPKG